MKKLIMGFITDNDGRIYLKDKQSSCLLPSGYYGYEIIWDENPKRALNESLKDYELNLKWNYIGSCEFISSSTFYYDLLHAEVEDNQIPILNSMGFILLLE